MNAVLTEQFSGTFSQNVTVLRDSVEVTAWTPCPWVACAHLAYQIPLFTTAVSQHALVGNLPALTEKQVSISSLL